MYFFFFFQQARMGSCVGQVSLVLRGLDVVLREDFQRLVFLSATPLPPPPKKKAFQCPFLSLIHWSLVFCLIVRLLCDVLQYTLPKCILPSLLLKFMHDFFQANILLYYMHLHNTYNAQLICMCVSYFKSHYRILYIFQHSYIFRKQT